MFMFVFFLYALLNTHCLAQFAARITVVQKLPHDAKAFTQGLLIDNDGQAYESTGLNGRSTLRRVDLASGRVLEQVQLPRELFAEGIAVVGDKIVQATWQNGIFLLHDKSQLGRYTRQPYGKGLPREGWGLTTDDEGTRLFMTDGSAALFVLDAASLEFRKKIPVLDDRLGRPVSMLNELEFVRGEVWANLYGTTCIVRIDPETGRVVGYLVGSNDLLAGGGGMDDVMNGIAYDAASDRLYITGKHWSALYEVTLEPDVGADVVGTCLAPLDRYARVFAAISEAHFGAAPARPARRRKRRRKRPDTEAARLDALARGAQAGPRVGHAA